MCLRVVPFVAVLILRCSPLLASEAHIGGVDPVPLDFQTLRLHGVDLPAVDEICTTSGGRKWPCGRWARDRLAEAAALDPIDCRPADQGTAVCRIAGIDIGALLVKEGLAKAAGDYQDLEDRARAARIGVWE